MCFLYKIKLLPIAGVVLLLLLTSGTALAHERRDVGEYQFVVGFIVEPALEGIKNGVDLRVTNTATEQPVEGLQDSLQVEITHVPSETSKVFSLRTIFGDPGHYTADLIPTAPGVYQMRFFGTIEETEVNETFVSRGGGGGFDDIESSTDLHFPEHLPELREIESAVRGIQISVQGAQDAALDASDQASSANTLAIVALVVGVVGIAAGAGSAFLSVRRH